MAHPMLRLVFAAVLVVAGAGFVYAQEGDGTGTEVATLTPADVQLPDMQPVLDLCALEDPAGACVGSSETYLLGLVGAGLPEADFSQSLADFVIALTAIAQSNPDCNAVDLEVADAIRLAAAQATDPGQATQFTSIADTIAACVDFQTAAIAPPASPA